MRQPSKSAHVLQNKANGHSYLSRWNNPANPAYKKGRRIWSMQNEQVIKESESRKKIDMSKVAIISLNFILDGPRGIR
jgi:hypothetical protein